ncbi:hypothetical protein ACRAWG_05115 [Methylobacterium sp. P31]
MPSSPILQPVTIGDLTLKNRVRMAPLTRSRSNAEGVTQESREVPDGVDFLDLRRRFEGAFIGNNDLTLDLAEKELAEGAPICSASGGPTSPIRTSSVASPAARRSPRLRRFTGTAAAPTAIPTDRA